MPTIQDMEPTIELVLQSGHSSTVATRFMSRFNKEDLDKSFRPAYNAMRNADIKYSTQSANSLKQGLEKILNSPLSKAKISDLALYIAILEAKPDNVLNIAAALPKEKPVWQKLLASASMTNDEIRDITGRNPMVAKTDSWSPTLLTEVQFSQLGLFQTYRYGVPGNGQFEFFVPQMYREKYARRILGEDSVDPHMTDNLPDEELVTENYERKISDDLIYLDEFDSYTPLLTDTGAITMTRVKSTANKINTSDFQVTGKEYPLSRKALVVLAFASMLRHRDSYLYKNDKKKGKTDDEDLTKNFARFLVNNFGADLSGSEFTTILPKYKGFTKKFTEYQRGRQICELVGKIIKETDGKWLNLDNFTLRYLCSDKIKTDKAAFTGLFPPANDRYKNLRLSDEDTYKASKGRSDSWKDLTLPFIIHYIKLLIGSGLLESASTAQIEPEDELEGLRFIRLTSLGRYAYGLTDQYESPETTDAQAFDFDPDNLIITLLKPDSPYALFLSQIGRKIGGNRYYVSAKTIIANAKDKTDLNNKIKTFKKKICRKPEGIWDEMLKDVEIRSNITREEYADFRLIALNPEVPGLIEFITQDKEIAENTIRAQNHYLLIYSSYYFKFLDRLQKAGYMA